MTTRGGNHFFVAAGGTGKSVEAARRALGSLFDREDRASQSAKRTWVARHESQLAKNFYCARGPRLWRTKGYGDVTGTTRAKSYTAHCTGQDSGGYCGTLSSCRESTICFASPKLQP